MAAPAPEAAKYAACAAKASDKPEAALDMAVAWRASGGGVAAQHCIALALLGLGKYDEAARRLEDVAQDLQTGHGTFGLADGDNSRLLPEVFGQAGNAWLLAGKYSRAYTTLSAGVAQTPPWSKLSGDLLLDRARALEGMRQYDKALADLDTARDNFPERADIRVYRAALLRALNRLAEAGSEITQGLKLEPDNPEALLERGNIYHVSGDSESARGDWSRVVELYPDTPEAEAAQKNISSLQATPPPQATHP